MTKTWILALAALCATALPAAAQEIPQAVSKKIDQAGKRAAGELFKLANWCAQQRAYDEARREYRNALRFQPGDAKVEGKLAKIVGKAPEPKAGYAEDVKERRKKAYEKCLDALVPAAEFAWAEDSAEAFDELSSLMVATFPDGKVRKQLKLIYFEGYSKWVHVDVYKQLRAGSERWEGKWLEPAEVAKLNEQHATWDKRWVLDDGFHQVETNMSLRVARMVLNRVTSFRKWMLEDYFYDEWDLRLPQKKLVVLVTGDQETYGKVCRADGIPPPETASAFYAPSTSKCYLTFEPRFEGGGSARVEFEHVEGTLRHELVHQICFESTQFGSPLGGGDGWGHWVSEGVAEFIAQFTLRADGTWQLSHPKQHAISMNRGSAAPFFWVKYNYRHLPTLPELWKIGQPTFKVKHYHQSATLTYYLLEGEDRRHRANHIKVIDLVHRRAANKDTFARVFDGLDLGRLGADFEAFTKKLPVDD